MRIARLLVLLTMMMTAGCTSRPVVSAASVPRSLNDITSQQWQALAERTIYFGHQSVGENILDGVRALAAANPQIRLHIVSSPPQPPSAALVEFHVGKNTEPATKNAAFLAATQGAQLGPAPVLMFKYCYIDMDEKTDADALFRAYEQTVAALRARHPEATLVHVTMPLTTAESRVRYYLNAVRGLPTERSVNARRNRFNELLRSTYGGKNAIFDLAEVESTHSDGSRAYDMLDGKPVYALAPEWTSDGGHLNAEGARRAAEQLLITLASLPNH